MPAIEAIYWAGAYAIGAYAVLDSAIGMDDLFHGDKYLRLPAINLLNKAALYNFLSTFSGTHFISPRSETVELGFHF